MATRARQPGPGQVERGPGPRGGGAPRRSRRDPARPRGLREARRLLPRPPVRSRDQAGERRRSLLYDSQGPRHPRRVRRHDRAAARPGSASALLEEARDRRHPRDRHRPEGRPRQPLLTFPELRAGGLRAVDQRGRRAAEGRRRRRRTPRSRRSSGGRGWPTWGQDGARIRRLRDAADVVVYTPGQHGGAAGLDPQVVRRAPPARSATTRSSSASGSRPPRRASSGSLGIDADPLQSREHILLAKILEAAWREGRDLDLPALIQQIQTPPFDAGRRARPRVVLPGEGPLRARDCGSTTCWPPRASTPGSRASRSTSARCSTRPRASRAPRSSRSRTSATPSGCSSSRSS